MKLAIKTLAVFFILVGISLLIKPDLLMGFLSTNADNEVIYWIAIISRIVVGALLFFAAAQSRFPTVMRVIGGLIVLAAVVFLFMGSSDFSGMLSGVISQVGSLTIASGILTIAIGGLLYYAFTGMKAMA